MLGHDPLPGPLLDLDEDDALIAQAVLERAQQIELDREELEVTRLRQHAEAVGVHAGNALSRLFRRR